MNIALLGDGSGSSGGVDLLWPLMACPSHLTTWFLNELLNGWEIPSPSPALPKPLSSPCTPLPPSPVLET